MAKKPYLKLYNENDVYMSPSGAVMDGQKVRKDYPASARFAHVVETDASGEMMYGFYNLAAMRSMHGVDASLSPEEAVDAIAEAMYQEQLSQEEAAAQPSTEERTAAALEFLAMNSLPDEQ